MGNWRDRALAAFVPGIASLLLVGDPDGLLVEDGVSDEIQRRGFDVLTFDDPPAFRLVYERDYREPRDQGRPDVRPLVVRTTGEVHHLPYDLLATGKQVEIGLATLFPRLSYPVLARLGTTWLDRVDAIAPGEPLGDRTTRELLLRHLFGVDVAQIQMPTDLLRVLLERATRREVLPEVLGEQVVETLRTVPAFANWPVRDLVLQPDCLPRFLQERWPAFVAHWLAEHDPSLSTEQVRAIAEPAAVYRTTGPTAVPFDDPGVRSLVDTLFLDGVLQPIDDPRSAPGQDDGWVQVGLRHDPAAQRERRVTALLGRLATTLPDADAHSADWLAFAPAWADLTGLWYDPALPTLSHQASAFRTLRDELDQRFKAWVLRRFGALYSQAGSAPTMVHQIPRQLARQREQAPNTRVALLVMDGLAIDQWHILRAVLQRDLPDVVVQDGAVFGWLPSITTVSRQAIFAGKPPHSFSSSIGTTVREAALWTQYWQNAGLALTAVGYLKGLASQTDLPALDELLGRPQVQVLGLVVDRVDEIMHGMVLGTAGMHNQVHQWAEQGFLSALLGRLLGAGWTVYLTADHGNVETVGIGSPHERALALSRGERVRVYSDPALRDRVHASWPDAVPWQPVGLPSGYWPLFAPGRAAFTPPGELRVSHGGMSLEELVVPYVKLERPQP